ncbi:sugar isomerase domain-containing protein [Micromonospora sp. NPDC047740]|uniref:sugar isomerase domain-containing protein n=1 Tax=Micromonospora sp. NPDC047740 TaxID=3364254 RepID=UPI00371C7B68
MTDAIARSFDAFIGKLRDAAATQAGALAAAADACADSLAAGGVIHVFDTGHLVAHEMVCRTGGLVAFTPLRYGGTLDNTNLRRGPRPAAGEEAERTLLRWVFAGDSLRRGDVLVISSVSGTSPRVIELALAARAAGLFVIALTAPAHAKRLDPEHSSGQRLHDVADVVLDNQAGYGDSMLDLDGLDVRANPASGVLGAALMWALNAGTIERLLARGVVPTVYQSVHLPGGWERLREAEARYTETGV